MESSERELQLALQVLLQAKERVQTKISTREFLDNVRKYMLNADTTHTLDVEMMSKK